MPLNSWLEKCFFSMQEDEKKPFLLTSEQEEALWDEIIVSTLPKHRFPGLDGISETAAKAWSTMVSHKLSWHELEYSHDQEVKAFSDWAGIFSKTCSQNGFLSKAELPGFMIRSLEKSLLTSPKILILAGFLEFNPAQTDYLDTMIRMNVGVYFLDNALPETKTSKVVFSEFKKEAVASASWALKLVLENPEVSVGVVVPGLETHHSRITRVFDHVFHPETICCFFQPEKKIFNISLGRPLGDYPLVHIAVVLLDLLKKDKWDIRELGLILGTPFIKGGVGEFQARAALDEKIRQGNQPWSSAQKVLELSSQQGEPYYCPVLHQILNQARKTGFSNEAIQTPARWAALFSKLLETLGWPDARDLNSFEYQTFQAFKEELSRLYQLEKILGAVTYSKALEKFNTLLSSRIFQPESVQAPVQILGLFEMAGLNFDHLWVMNFTSEVLPCPSKPNPLLPVELQRKYLTPGSSPMRELDLAKRIMKSILVSSKEIIFSHSTHEDDREVLESPLLADVSGVDQEDIPTAKYHGFYEPACRSSDLTAIIDDYGEPLKESWLPGGVRAFQDQALCPFKGYAAHRLNARSPEEPVFALTPIDRGNMVHKALMRLWQEVGSLEELKEMIDQGSLDSILDEVAHLTVREFQIQGHALFTPEFMDLEHARLKDIISKWLKKELERRDFHILALEKTEYLSINGIKIKTRMDRLDRLDAGGVIIIDYKTGASIDSVENMWMGDRIIEPQLPIYSQIVGNDTSGVVLAQVNPGAFKFHGMISGDEISFKDNRLQTPRDMDLSGIKEVLDQWSSRLTAISREIIEGFALVDPLTQSGDKTCRHCDYLPLCRIRERNTWQE